MFRRPFDVSRSIVRLVLLVLVFAIFCELTFGSIVDNVKELHFAEAIGRRKIRASTVRTVAALAVYASCRRAPTSRM